jgi:hypothetical protein
MRGIFGWLARLLWRSYDEPGTGAAAAAPLQLCIVNVIGYQPGAGATAGYMAGAGRRAAYMPGAAAVAGYQAGARETIGYSPGADAVAGNCDHC